jgi:hypothetical protein
MGAVMLLGCPVVLLSPLAEKRLNNGKSESEKEMEQTSKNRKN